MELTDRHLRILVTGATGFVGSYLLRYLLKKGYQNITALKRSGSNLDLVNDIYDKINWVECDVLDLLGLEDIIAEVELVYHCAAMVSFTAKERKLMVQVNAEGTANVVNLCLAGNVKKMVHVSSIAAIGRVKQGTTINEQSKWEHSKYNTYYAISKYAAEREVWRGMAEGLNAVIINPSMILGAGRWEDGPQTFFKLLWNNLSFYPLGVNGFVDVRDVAQMMIQLMESDISDQRYICSADNLAYRQLMKLIAEKLGKKPPTVPVQPYMNAIAWRWEWLKSTITGQAPAVTKETAYHSSRIFYYENKKSIKELKFAYRPLEQTIEETVEQFQKAAKQDFETRVFPTDQLN